MSVDLQAFRINGLSIFRNGEFSFDRVKMGKIYDFFRPIPSKIIQKQINNKVIGIGLDKG